MGVNLNKMPFQRFIEVGRFAVLADGADKGKVAAVVNVIDQNRVLIDGPCSGVRRQAYRIKNLHMTPLVTKFPFSARTKVVRAAWKKMVFLSNGKNQHGPSVWL